MRITGWCVHCRCFRPVLVNAQGLVRIATGGVATGVCSRCEEKIKAARSRRKEL